MNNNRFGNRLGQLLVSADIKNFTLAQSLKYDVSYISKWISGKAVPSKKNIESIVNVVCSLVVNHGSKDFIAEIKREYNASDDEQLQDALKKELLGAYHETVGDFDYAKYVNNASVVIRPEGQYPLLQDYARGIDTSKPMEIAILADLFSMDHMSKLLLAGIENNRFRVQKERPDIHLHFILDIGQLDGHSVYDVILFVHMLTNYSLLNFTLSQSKAAKGKLLFSIMKHYAGISLLTDSGQFLCTVSSRDKEVGHSIYDNIIAHENPDQNLFSSLTLRSMLETREYMQLLLEQNNRWLVGHMMELFITKDLFDQLLKSEFPEEELARREAERAYLIAQNIFEREDVFIMIYNSALTNFMLSGELDFFNKKIVLDAKERKKQLEHLKNLFLDHRDLHVKMVSGGFSDDFRYITNPCMFLSDTVNYLRLENDYYDKNILLVRDSQLREVFNIFYDEIWNDRQDVVVSERQLILEQLDNLMNAATLLSDVE